MPELPDIVAYIAAIEERVVGRVLREVRIRSPFVLRTVDPPIASIEGMRITEVRRIGKRIVLVFAESDLRLVIHLMIAGRFHLKPANARIASRADLAAFDFDAFTIVLTEAGTKSRASLSLVRGDKALNDIDPGGVDPLRCDLETFKRALTKENRTVKRALTDPHVVDGIGNAYSDEILHAARLSPIAQTQKITHEQWARLHVATRDTLHVWIERLTNEAKDAFPEKVTAFRKEMAVHGKCGKPCPVCATPVRRIRRADNEANYCARCQTGGRIIADGGLSQLLKSDRPKTLEAERATQEKRATERT